MIIILINGDFSLYLVEMFDPWCYFLLVYIYILQIGLSLQLPYSRINKYLIQWHASRMQLLQFNSTFLIILLAQAIISLSEFIPLLEV